MNYSSQPLSEDFMKLGFNSSFAKSIKPKYSISIQTFVRKRVPFRKWYCRFLCVNFWRRSRDWKFANLKGILTQFVCIHGDFKTTTTASSIFCMNKQCHNKKKKDNEFVILQRSNDVSAVRVCPRNSTPRWLEKKNTRTPIFQFWSPSNLALPLLGRNWIKSSFFW